MKFSNADHKSSKGRYGVLACLMGMLMIVACTPQATPAPTVDTVSTMAVQMVSVMLTQTAAAFVPSPVPPTDTPAPTETITPEPTSGKAPNVITVVNYTACYQRGPGPSAPLVTHINVPKDVELLGIGSVDGWYVISAPYFYSPCWVSAADVVIGSNVDLSTFPIMTPGN